MKLEKPILLVLIMLGLTTAVKAQFTFTTKNGAVTITRYTGFGGTVLIPETLAGSPVTSIGTGAFSSTKVSSVLIPDSVTNIGTGAFSECASLTNVTVGNSLVSIGVQAFSSCYRLKSINFRGNLPKLPAIGSSSVFSGSPATIYYLYGTTGWSSTLDGRPAVLWNPPVPFTYETNDDGITVTITGYTGSGNNVIIPDSINFLPVNTIGDYAFTSDSSLENITIPNSVTIIGTWAFAECSSLTNAIIGNSVSNIEDLPFSGCASLTAIVVDSHNLFFSSLDGVLFNFKKTMLVEYPPGKAGDYAIPNSVTDIATQSMGFCSQLKAVTIPNGVTNIADYAFYGSSLTSVTIPSTLKSIGGAVFQTCTGLTSVTIGGCPAGTGESTFYDCTSLANLTISNGVTGIGDYSFYDCISLTNITIPGSVTNIGEHAFDFCISLTNFTMLKGVKTVGDFALYHCYSLAGLTIPDSVTTIGGYAFSSCQGLTSLIIPGSVTNLDDYAFAACFNLKNVFFDGNAPSHVGLGVFSTMPYSFVSAAFDVFVTAYYLPGTTGWDEFADLTACTNALWLPQMQTAVANFGGLATPFGFNINWASGKTVVVEASTNLFNPVWKPVQTNTLTTGSAYFNDPQWTNYPGRFYRLRSP